MSNIAGTQVQPGWYQDPMGDNDLRWWDGDRWSEHTLRQATPLATAPAASPIPSLSSPSAHIEPTPISSLSSPGAHLEPTSVQSLSSPGAHFEPTPFPSRRQLRAQWEAELASVEVTSEVDVPELTPATLDIPTSLLRAAPARPSDSSTPSGPWSLSAMAASPPATTAAPQVEAAAATAAATVTSPTAASAAGTSATGTSATAASAAAAAAGSGTRPTPLAPIQTLTPISSDATPAISRLVAVPERGSFVPFATQAPWRSSASSRPQLVNTLSVWLLVFVPLIYPIILVTVIFSLDMVVPTVQLGIGLIIVLWMLLLVVRDARELKAAGHEKVASPTWILLTPPAYLLARAIYVHRQTGHGFAPFVTWMVLSAIVAAATLAAPVMLGIWS